MTAKRANPLRIINSVAPIRICDNGGWTDTWFAGHGKIFNIGVYPYAEVQIEVYGRDEQEERVIINAENYGERYGVTPGEQRKQTRHPLLEAAIERMKVPEEAAIHVTIFSEAPAGASVGTSAAVTVALIGALDSLTPGRLTRDEIARAAHSIEVDALHQQSGIQDQLCSVHGGINFIEMARYPEGVVTQLSVPDPVWWELERRLVLVFLGRSHSSSEVHEKVIRELSGEGPDCKRLADLRITAERSRDAILSGDFRALGAAMTENTGAQGRLHPELISRDAWRVIEIAREHGALGWKVNGAGGLGGSITILADSRSHVKRTMTRAIEQENALFKNIPVYLSRFGIRIWETAGAVKKGAERA